ncbi:MAG TPA: glycosyltransferase [Candidatus Dormibacteraeota bacterium]|nr:glycosyltransferase [Candidatus Dormibacteraeota bacterium]
MSSTLPRAAVIVAVYNGAETLQDCLESLLRLDYPATRHEVIVVDNASTDATAAILSDYGGRIRLCFEERRGPAAARNRGLQATTAEVVAFTDADCTVDPAWLRHLVAPLPDPSVGVVGGRILSRRPCNRIEAFGEHIHDHARAMYECTPPYAITMNWASRREVLEAVGRFNETLLRSSDVDCAYRMVSAGYRLVYVPEAVIYHRNERTPWGLVHEGYVHAVHAPRVRALHRELLARARDPRRPARPAPPIPLEHPPSHWSDALWRSLFLFGKRLGRAHAAWRDRS